MLCQLYLCTLHKEIKKCVLTCKETQLSFLEYLPQLDLVQHWRNFLRILLQFCLFRIGALLDFYFIPCICQLNKSLMICCFCLNGSTSKFFSGISLSDVLWEKSFYIIYLWKTKNCFYVRQDIYISSIRYLCQDVNHLL